MGTLTNVFQWLLERLHDCWPIRIVDADEQGVLFSGGRNLRLLEPGLHFFLPKFQRIEKVNVKYQEIDCPTQALDTSDGHSVLISINIGYEIKDAVLWRTEVQSFDSTVERRARGIVAGIVLGRRLEELRSQEVLASIRSEVLRDLRRMGKAWGARFRNVGISDLARARPLRIFNN